MARPAREAREARQARECPPQAHGCASPQPGLRRGQDGGAPGRDTTGPAPGSNGNGNDAANGHGDLNPAPTPKPQLTPTTGKPSPKK